VTIIQKLAIEYLTKFNTIASNIFKKHFNTTASPEGIALISNHLHNIHNRNFKDILNLDPKEYEKLSEKQRLRKAMDKMEDLAMNEGVEIGHLDSKKKPFKLKTKRDSSTPSIYINGKSTSNKKEVKKALLEFWSKTFSEYRPFSKKKLKKLLKNYKYRIPPNFEKHKIDMELFSSIIMKKNNTSPGINGIPFSLYSSTFEKLKLMWENILTISMKNPHLFLNLVDSKIILLPKDKYPLNPEQFRPISITNTHYRIIMKYWAAIMRNILNETISKEQVAILENRSIDDAIFDIVDLLYAKDLKKKNIFLLQTDFCKAYDYLNRDAIRKVCKHIGIPEWMMNIIEIALLENSSKLYEGTFNSVSGVRQGCPLSGYLYIIIFDLLINEISKVDGVKLIRGYMDDLGIVIDNEEAFVKVRKIIQLYEEATGASLNTFKSIIVYNFEKPSKLNIKDWDDVKIVQESTYLGYIISFLNKQKSFDTSLSKISNRTKILADINGSPRLKLALANVYLASIPIYISRFALPTPTQSALYFKYIRKSLRSLASITNHLLVAPASRGGLSIPLRDLLFSSISLLLSVPKRERKYKLSSESPSGQREIALRLYSHITKMSIEEININQPYITSQKHYYFLRKYKPSISIANIIYNTLIKSMDFKIPLNLPLELQIDEYGKQSIVHNIILNTPPELSDTWKLLLAKKWFTNHQTSLIFKGSNELCKFCNNSPQTHYHILTCPSLIPLILWAGEEISWPESEFAWPDDPLDLIGCKYILDSISMLIRLIILKVIKSVNSNYRNGYDDLEYVFQHKVKILYSKYYNRLHPKFKKKKKSNLLNILPLPPSYISFDESFRDYPMRSSGAAVLWHHGKEIDMLYLTKDLGTLNDGAFLGLKCAYLLTIKHNINNIPIYGDSNMIKSNFENVCSTTNPDLIILKNELPLLENPHNITVNFFPREFNERADIYAYSLCRDPLLFKNVDPSHLQSRFEGDVNIDCYDIENTEQYKNFMNPRFPSATYLIPLSFINECYEHHWPSVMSSLRKRSFKGLKKRMKNLKNPKPRKIYKLPKLGLGISYFNYSIRHKIDIVDDDELYSLPIKMINIIEEVE
jgi:hypothetical protein